MYSDMMMMMNSTIPLAVGKWISSHVLQCSYMWKVSPQLLFISMMKRKVSSDEMVVPS